MIWAMWHVMVDDFPAIVKVDDFDYVTHSLTFSFYLSLYTWVSPIHLHLTHTSNLEGEERHRRIQFFLRLMHLLSGMLVDWL
ncbi:hypothetical protein Hanom_Chr01g00052281 [Helianthus anomalus]